jgi:hypothetical protein
VRISEPRRQTPRRDYDLEVVMSLYGACALDVIFLPLLKLHEGHAQLRKKEEEKKEEKNEKFQ